MRQPQPNADAGREDVCLEYKKLLTAYDTMQLERKRGDIAVLLDSATPAQQPALAAAAALFPLIEKNEFPALETEARLILSSTWLTTTDNGLQKSVKTSAAALAGASKRREASPAARAIIKLATDLQVVADSL